MGFLPPRPFLANQFHQQPMRRPLLRFRFQLGGETTADMADQPRRVIPLFPRHFADSFIFLRRFENFPSATFWRSRVPF
jgi:hypothetical protein